MMVLIRPAYHDKEGLANIIDDFSDEAHENIELTEYSKEDYYGDFMKVTQSKSNPALADHLSSKSYESIFWMKEQGRHRPADRRDCPERLPTADEAYRRRGQCSEDGE